MDQRYLMVEGESGNSKAFFIRDSEEKIWNARFPGYPEVGKRWDYPVLHNSIWSQVVVRTPRQALYLSISPEGTRQQNLAMLDQIRVGAEALPGHSGPQILWPLPPLPKFQYQ